MLSIGRQLDTTDLVKYHHRIFEVDAHHFPHSRVNLRKGTPSKRKRGKGQAGRCMPGGKGQAGRCMPRLNPTDRQADSFQCKVVEEIGNVLEYNTTGS